MSHRDPLPHSYNAKSCSPELGIDVSVIRVTRARSCIRGSTEGISSTGSISRRQGGGRSGTEGPWTGSFKARPVQSRLRADFLIACIYRSRGNTCRTLSPEQKGRGR